MHAQQLYNLISSQINDAEREYSPDGQVVIKIVRSSAQSPKPPSAPIYGAIIGCCGRAPFVHYFRDGQRCCPDGQVEMMRSNVWDLYLIKLRLWMQMPRVMLISFGTKLLSHLNIIIIILNDLKFTLSII